MNWCASSRMVLKPIKLELIAPRISELRSNLRMMRHLSPCYKTLLNRSLSIFLLGQLDVTWFINWCCWTSDKLFHIDNTACFWHLFTVFFRHCGGLECWDGIWWILSTFDCIWNESLLNLQFFNSRLIIFGIWAWTAYKFLQLSLLGQ